jgi:hypothetical protein
MPVRLDMMREKEVEVREGRACSASETSPLEETVFSDLMERVSVGRSSDQAIEKGCDIQRETEGR